MKKIILSILLVLISVNVFAEKWNVYAGADEQTLEIIKECDELIEKKQYLSASHKVGGCANEYMIYKYIEVCTQYFAQSLMHSMFAFKDLEENETLMDVRTASEGEFSITYRETPDETIDNYLAEHGNSLVLELARANYYYDAICRYGDQWLKTPAEVDEYIRDVYTSAVAAEAYDERVLANYASVVLNDQNWPETEKIYASLAEKNSTNGNYWYNLAVSKMQQGKYADAIYPSQMAVDNPEEDPNYHLDAFLILADAYSYSGDFESAEKVLLNAHETYDYQPVVFQRLAELFIIDEEHLDYDKANSYLDKVLTVVCDANTIYNCISLYMNYCPPQMAIDFCTRNLKVYKEKINQGIFNFFIAQIYGYTQDSVNAKKYLDKAEKIFKKLKDTQWMENCQSIRAQMNL